jgi:F0F1-type ATP synthase assembly protein I
MPDDKGTRKKTGEAYEALTLGFLFPVATALGFGIGYGLDKVFHTWPWLTIIFTVIGVAGAFVQLFRAGTGKDGSG